MYTRRLGLIPDTSFMEKIKSHKYIKDRKEVKPLIIRALRLLYDLELDEAREMDVYNPLTRPRVPHEVLFVIGGWSGGSPTNVVETYDTRADRWVHCAFAQDAGARAYHGCAAVFVCFCYTLTHTRHLTASPCLYLFQLLILSICLCMDVGEL